MPTPIGDFDYHLPPEFIAQQSIEPRDHSKLMLLDRRSGVVEHRKFLEIVDLLKAGDVLVFNTSKVFKARLLGEGLEVFVLKIFDREIEALIRPGRKFMINDMITLHGQGFIVKQKSDDGVVRLTTDLTKGEMLELCDRYGSVPIPPYVEDKGDDLHYQNVYAKETGSVAAPTAGFHFTQELLDKLRSKGVQIEEVVLHVGIGTFRPVQTETIEEHTMHSEWVNVDEGVAVRIVQAKSEGRRIIAVGTTTTRVLEGIVDKCDRLQAYEGEITMFIRPGFEFRVIDGLITNFHLPKSTLLMLVSAFAGRESVLHAYEEAKKYGYRFFFVWGCDVYCLTQLYHLVLCARRLHMQRITLVTGNPNKLREVSAILGVDGLESVKLDLLEPQSDDLREIVRMKVQAAFAAVGGPVLVEDVSFEIDALGGFPGTFVKYFEGTMGYDRAMVLVERESNARARARCCVGYQDSERVIVYEAIVEGRLVPRSTGQGWGFDYYFVPDGHDETYAQMGPERKNQISHRFLAFTGMRDRLRAEGVL